MFIIKGRVIKGAGYGKKIGFPTLNLDRRHFLALKQKPSFGIYYGTAVVLDKIYKAGIVIGPNDKRGIPKIEAHLLGFSSQVYGQKVVLELKKFMRNFKVFNNDQELMSQIKKDMSFVASQQVI